MFYFYENYAYSFKGNQKNAAKIAKAAATVALRKNAPAG
jgi:hypothetical protein